MKLNEIKTGDWINLDDGFTCRKKGAVEVIEQDGVLGFVCDEGFHTLDGQKDKNGDLIGIS